MIQAPLAAPKLVVRDLTQKFGTVTVLDCFNLEIREREFVCILGASGCGKSTLFNAVSGLLQVTSGSILLDGQDIVGRPGQVGYMLQKDLLLPWRSVLDNIVLGAALTRGATRPERRRAADLATRYGLGDFLHHYPQALSGGMRQRAALMRTIAAQRELILLDEPFGALDSQTRLGMQQWLLEVWRDMGRTVLFVTHDVDEAIFLADRLVVMLPRPGRIGLMRDVNIARPRGTDSLTTPEFTALKREIMNVLYGHPAHPGLAPATVGGAS
jgi:ABC-type nitrate/sulfonate/bicarbonate transport system ATPase subunit